MFTQKAEDDSMQRMIEIASSFLYTNNSRLLISISSGATHIIRVNKADPDMMDQFSNIYYIKLKSRLSVRLSVCVTG